MRNRGSEVGGFQVMADPEGTEFCFIVGPTLVAGAGAGDGVG